MDKLTTEIEVQPEKEVPQVVVSTHSPAGNKKWLLLAVVVLLLGVGAVVLRDIISPKKTPVATVNSHSNVLVSVTKAGFIPQTISIKSGTAVTWTNTDSSEHQVAADPYPNDTSIPNFNSAVVLLKDSTLSFTFDNVGTYTYHDEKNPLQFKGTIIVK